MKTIEGEPRSSRKRQVQKLEKLLLEGFESGAPTPLTKMDFDEIKKEAPSGLIAENEQKPSLRDN